MCILVEFIPCLFCIIYMTSVRSICLLIYVFLLTGHYFQFKISRMDNKS